MDITINDELRSYTDPLSASEYAALESSILAEGCRDALVLWGNVLVDGHNRYAICRKHGIEFRTVQNDRFHSIEDVMLWMIDNHLARRSVSDFQRGMLALRKKAILAARVETGEPDTADPAAPASDGPASSATADTSASPPAAAAPAAKVPLATREEVARIAGISSNALSRIEKIQKTAAPELVEAIRSGTISVNAAAAVASLPSEQQVAAVAAGKKELQQVARQVRESRSATRPARAEGIDHGDEGEPSGSETALLKARIEELSAENAALKQRVAELSAALGGAA